MADDQTTGLENNPFMGALQGMAQPQQQDQTQPQQDQTASFSASNDPVLDQFKGFAKDALSESSDFNKQIQPVLQAALQKINYTPEMRARDKYARMLGQKEMPGPQQEGIATQYLPLTFKQKIGNFVKEGSKDLIASILPQLTGGPYKTPMQRARQQAMEEYKAETTAVGPELRTLALEKSRLEGVAGNAIKNLQMGLVRQQQANTQEERAKTYQAIQTAKEKMDVFRAAKFESDIQKNTAQMSEIEANKYIKELTAGDLKRKQEYWDKYGLPVNATEAALDNKDISDGNYARMEERYRAKGLGRGESVQFFTDASGQPTGLGVTRGANAGSVRSINQPANPTPGTPYASDYTAPTKLSPFSDTTPEDLSTKNLYSMPQMKSNPSSRLISAGLNLYTTGKEFEAGLAKLDPNSMGTVKGNMAKILNGSIAPKDLAAMGINVSVIPYLQAKAKAIANAHLGTQSMRSFFGADEIAKEIASWGTDLDVVLQKLRGFTDQAIGIFQTNPGSKKLVHDLPGMTGQEFKRIFTSTPGDVVSQTVNDTQKQQQPTDILKEIDAEIQRRKGKK